jgi:hypothetical protein
MVKLSKELIILNSSYESNKYFNNINLNMTSSEVSDYKEKLYKINNLSDFLFFLFDYDKFDEFDIEYLEELYTILRNSQSHKDYSIIPNLDNKFNNIYNKINSIFNFEIKNNIIKYISFLSQKLSHYKNNDEKLFYELNILPLDKLNNLALIYENRSQQKVNEIRIKLINSLKTGFISPDYFLKLKDEINLKYSTNIFKSWSNFGILLPFIYSDKLKKKIYDLLNLYLDDLIKDLSPNGFSMSKKIVGFEGSTNFGSTRLWFALYNSNHKSHLTAKQLFFSIDFNNSERENIQYGLYSNDDGFKDRVISYSENSFKYYDLLDHFKTLINNIKDDNNVEEDTLSENEKKLLETLKELEYLKNEDSEKSKKLEEKVKEKSDEKYEKFIFYLKQLKFGNSDEFGDNITGLVKEENNWNNSLKVTIVLFLVLITFEFFYITVENMYSFISTKILLGLIFSFCAFQYSKTKKFRLDIENRIAIASAYFSFKGNDKELELFGENISNTIFSKFEDNSQTSHFNYSIPDFKK